VGWCRGGRSVPAKGGLIVLYFSCLEMNVYRSIPAMDLDCLALISI
jgi:hypothetical protein